MHALELHFASTRSSSCGLLAADCRSLEPQSWKPQELLCGSMIKAQELLCGSMFELQELLCSSLRFFERNEIGSAFSLSF